MNGHASANRTLNRVGHWPEKPFSAYGRFYREWTLQAFEIAENGNIRSVEPPRRGQQRRDALEMIRE
jgi:hypothetical protein